MNVRSPTSKQPLVPPSSVPGVTALLQRKCNTCGQHTIAGGHCTDCQKSRSLGQRLGRIDDRYEQEADRIADYVMGSAERSTQSLSVQPVITPLVQRQAMDEDMEDDDEEQVQRKRSDRSDTPLVSSALQSDLVRLRQSGGNPLPIATRTFMESRFGRDLSDVRIHTDSQATALSHQLNARAFTIGRDIVFNHNQFQPNSYSGRWLLAHELTHTIQQQKGVITSQQHPLQIQRAGLCGTTPDGKDLGPTNPLNRRGKRRKRPRLCKADWDRSALKLDLKPTAPGLSAYNQGAIEVFEGGDAITRALTRCNADCLVFRQFVKVKAFENGVQQPNLFVSCGMTISTSSNEFIEESVNCFTSTTGRTRLAWNDQPGRVWQNASATPQAARFDFTVRVLIWDSCLGMPKKALEGNIILFKNGPNKWASAMPFEDASISFPFISPSASC